MHVHAFATDAAACRQMKVLLVILSHSERGAGILSPHEQKGDHWLSFVHIGSDGDEVLIINSDGVLENLACPFPKMKDLKIV